MKNTMKFGFRGSGTIIIFLMIIAFVFAAMTACEGPEGQQGPAGKDGEDAISEVTRVTVGGVEQWAIDGVPTGIKIDGEATLAIDYNPLYASFPRTKGFYYANQPIRLEYRDSGASAGETTVSGSRPRADQRDGAVVKVKYKLYEEVLVQGTGFFLFYNGQKVGADNFANTYPTAEEGNNKIILIYGPAKEPLELKINVEVFDFSAPPSIHHITNSVGPVYGPPDSNNVLKYGENLKAVFTPSAADNQIAGPITDADLVFQWYKNGVPVVKPEALPANPNYGKEAIFEARSFGEYTVGMKALGFAEIFTDVIPLKASFDNGTKLTTYLTESSATTTKNPLDVYWTASSLAGVKEALQSGVKYVKLDITGCAGATAIGDSAFEDCQALFLLTLPKNLASVGDRVFNNCPNLTQIKIEPNGTTDFEALEGNMADAGVLYNKDGGDKELVFWPPRKVTSAITVQSDVTSIKGFAIAYVENLVNLTIEGADTIISADAVTNCPNLTKVTFWPEISLAAGVNDYDVLEEFGFRGIGNLQFVIEQVSHQINTTPNAANPTWVDKAGKAVYERIDEDIILAWKKKSDLTE
jgi:hypothetical protein